MMLPARMNMRARLLGSTYLSGVPPLRKPRPRCIVLFGAGSSAFCDGVSPGQPPLGYKLFEELDKFDPFFGGFAEDLKNDFRNNFEVGMERFARERNPELHRLLCLMSLYFLQFDLIDPAKNFYCKFVDLAFTHRFQIGYATLNYDLLLEAAMIATKRTARWDSVLKLHGSPNYLVGESLLWMSRDITVAHAFHAIADGPVAIRDPQTAKVFCKASLERNVAVATPAISIYAKGKRVYHSPGYIEMLQKMFRDAAADAGSVLLIGVNVNEEDDHIWAPIASSKARIGVVNPNFEQVEEWAKRNGKQVTWLGKSANEIVDSDAHRAALIAFVNQ